MLASTHHEIDELAGGVIRHTQHIKRIAYYDGGSLVRQVTDFVDGDATWAHVVQQASQPLYTAADGMRRFHPTREADRYIEIGAPYIKPSTTWTKVNLGTATRTANRLMWTTANANVIIDHGGHFVKMGILLKNGWTPPGNQVAFPVGLSGLTRSGGNILRDGVVVAHLTPPHVEDYDNPIDKRPVDWQFVNVSGQAYLLFTLPDVSGMSKPLIDPTLTLQPAEADGIDCRLLVVVPNTNFNDDALSIGENKGGVADVRRSLIQFDLSSITGATIVSAALSLTLLSVGSAFADNNRTAYVYRVRAGRDWVETEATWNVYKTGNSWTTAGCDDTTNDREATDIGSAAFATTDLAASVHTFNLTPGAGGVQDWVDGTLTNRGMLLKMDTELDDLYDVASSGHATAGYRPKLVVEYTAAAAAAPQIRRAPGWGRW